MKDPPPAEASKPDGGDAGSDDDRQGGAGGAETRGQMVQRHKRVSRRVDQCRQKAATELTDIRWLVFCAAGNASL
jgi:hypothetical protein